MRLATSWVKKERQKKCFIGGRYSLAWSICRFKKHRKIRGILWSLYLGKILFSPWKFRKILFPPLWKNTFALEATILFLVRLECAEELGESCKTFIALWQQLEGKKRGKKKRFWGKIQCCWSICRLKKRRKNRRICWSLYLGKILFLFWKISKNAPTLLDTRIVA